MTNSKMVRSYNKDLSIIGKSILLKPYIKEYVLKYHKWMQDPYLMEVTASEPLTLEEEYEMQEKWHLDQDKLTFIIFNKRHTDDGIKFSNEPDLENMIGDVNIFFKEDSDFKEGEISIMIAEKDSRHKGKGEEVLKYLIRFAYDKFEMKFLFAKIKIENISAIKLFEKLGFIKKSTCDFFKEVTYELELNKQCIESKFNLK